MNVESKINVHHSSLVGLKTELLRKQAEVKATKAKQEHFIKTKTKDKICYGKQKVKKFEKNIKLDKSEDIESIRTLQKSKLMLQAKSRLYEKLSKTQTNVNPNFLVDFIQKSNYLNCPGDEYEKVDNDNKTDYDCNSEWVEFMDCFGRTRKCLRRDLHTMQEKDEFTREKMNDKEYDKVHKQLLHTEDKLPKIEPEIEVIRKKWEEQAAKLTNKLNIHYEDILYDEARTHGVGYYSFSQNEEERIKQQENLLKLRKETEQKQKENKEINDVKDKLQQNRLKVARLRQRMRAGLPIEEYDEEIVINNSTILSKSETNLEQDIVINNQKNVQSEQCNVHNVANSFEENNELTSALKQSNKKEGSNDKLANVEKKIETFEQLLGKRNRWYIMSQDEWVNKKRKERTNEFGPIYENFRKDNKDTSNFDLMTISQDYNTRSISTRDNSTTIESLSLSPSKSCSPKPNKIIKEVTCQNLDDTKVNTNIVCQIEAGLKYLRNQFDNNHT